jgi:hypothetical protein
MRSALVAVAALAALAAAAPAGAALPADGATVHIVSLCPRPDASSLPPLGRRCNGVGRAELADGRVVAARIAWSRNRPERFAALLRLGTGAREVAVRVAGSFTFIEDNGFFGSGSYRDGLQRGRASWVAGSDHAAARTTRLRWNLTLQLRAILLP